MIRFFDLTFAALGLFFGSPVLVVLCLIGLFDTGSPIFKQQRMGRFKQPFTLVKFRTMRTDTVSVASHLASADAITPFGHFLRRTKLDELPQLWNVLTGDMSLVGPRPNLFSQAELIEKRDALGVYDVRPGITGLAQISNIDMSMPMLLAKTDREMIDNLLVSNYFRYIIATVAGKGRGDSVKN